MKKSSRNLILFISLISILLLGYAFVPAPSNTDYITNNKWVLYDSEISPAIYYESEWINNIYSTYDSCELSQTFNYNDSIVFVVHDTLDCDTFFFQNTLYYWEFYNSETELILMDLDSIRDTLDILLLEEDTLRLLLEFESDSGSYDLTQTFVPE